MAFEKRVALRGSERKPLADSHITGEVSPAEMVRVTVVLARAGGDPEVVRGKKLTRHLSHEEFAGQHGADPKAIQMVERFAQHSGLTVVESSLRKRRVILTGTVEAMSAAFGTELKAYRVDTTGPHFRGRTGTISIPQELTGSVIAVLGLDNRPVAKPHFRMRKSHRGVAPRAATSTTFTPPQVAALYNFPTDVDGSGQTIAIIELGGGYTAADLTKFFDGVGIKQPNVSAIAVDTGANTPGSDADGEVELDIEVAGSIAPGANIAVYFAPNTDQGFINAITDAAHDTTRRPSVISISWGGPEDSWTPQSQQALNAALQDAATLGITVTAAAGDNGSSDGVTDGNLHVDFPASSPFILACGGTTLAGSGNNITSETVWNETAQQEGATGGGVSKIFPLPAYQQNAGVPANPQTSFVGRGVPDISGDADPSTGYQIVVDGQAGVVGGTSAVAPLWAALIALINQKLGRPVGFINPALYALAASPFLDITTGNNDDSGLGYFSAGPGWDACTGLGSPDGTALLNALLSSQTITAPSASGVAAGSLK
jgi:kumamolisin